MGALKSKDWTSWSWKWGWGSPCVALGSGFGSQPMYPVGLSRNGFWGCISLWWAEPQGGWLSAGAWPGLSMPVDLIARVCASHPAGTQDTEPCFSPQNLTCFKNSTKSWVGFSGGQHHTVCVDSEGE